jgi:hypothetical protein
MAIFAQPPPASIMASATLAGLGTHAEHPGDRPTLLRRSRTAMGHRGTWGMVDAGAVRTYVATLRSQEAPHA